MKIIIFLSIDILAYKVLSLALIACIFFALPNPSFAQSNDAIVITNLKIDKFPVISFIMDVVDKEGQLIPDLQTKDIKLSENGSPRTLLDLQKATTGLQITVAINANPILENHFAGLSNLERIQQTLEEWAKTQPINTPDDFSLSSNSGLVVAHQSLPKDWIKAITGYKPDLLKSQPDLKSLTQALDLAANPNTNPGMKRTILYISPALKNDLLPSISALTLQAQQLGVRVFIWMVVNNPTNKSKSLDAFNALASGTGGKLFVFSGTEKLPDPESYFGPLRYQYYVSYNSFPQPGGDQRLIVEINRENLHLVSQEKRYQINISAVNPIFLSPPTQIVRGWVKNADNNEILLDPKGLLVEIIVEFPDGKTRSLKYSALYVDGKIVVENFLPPFEKFKWDLKEYNISGNHSLQVKVEDALGLVGNSIKIPVEILITALPESEPATQQWIIIIAISVAAAILIIVLLLAGRRITPLKKQIQNRKEFKDPVTQPLFRRNEILQSQPVAANPPVPTVPVTKILLARLIRVTEDGSSMSEKIIPITSSELTLGSDPQQAIRVIDDPSVSPIHARLFQGKEGEFFLADAGSFTGTWINYAPVSSQGAHLINGDLIHIGRAAFRFERYQANPSSASTSDSSLWR